MRLKKPKSIYQNRPAALPVAPADPDILLTANCLVLTTEDKNKFVALYREYLDEYNPQGPTQRDLVEEMVAAKWRQRRCSIIETGILNVTMDRMADKIEEEFVNLPNSIRTALAFLDQHGADGALARIARDEARRARTWHRALKLLRELQKEKMPNEPEPDLKPLFSIIRKDSPAPVRDSSPEPPPAPGSLAGQAGRPTEPRPVRERGATINASPPPAVSIANP
jgi:hypothetical protein